MSILKVNLPLVFDVNKYLNSQNGEQAQYKGAMIADFTSKDEQGKRLANSSVVLSGKEGVELLASESTSHQQHKNQSYGHEVGMAFSVGGKTGWSVYAKEGFQKGKQTEESTTHHNSHIDTERLTLNSGGDVIIKGATAKANAIHTDINGNPIKSETAVVVGYKSGELVGEGKVFVNGKFNQQGVEDIVKDGVKTVALGKFPWWQQGLYGTAIDYGYEVNKDGSTKQSINTEMLSSGVGTAVSSVSELGSKLEPKLNGINKIILNVIGADKISDYIKDEYKGNE